MKHKAPRQAIALSYDGASAPSLTAKGDDELAEAILAIAREYEVPIYENAELVRLLARLELGDAIPEPLYRSIAEIIAFAWYLKGKRPAGFAEEPAERDVTSDRGASDRGAPDSFSPARPLLAAPRE